jgi:hypothetical protein
VPEKYWNLRGDHEPHPGPGEGPGAMRWANRTQLDVGESE